ncbi:MAG TPA: hypothetical protein VMU92_13660 [Acidobacteriaceae bacterium]|nr:hypothetical protein [Acidobacteriaceae bacterium]
MQRHQSKQVQNSSAQARRSTRQRTGNNQVRNNQVRNSQVRSKNTQADRQHRNEVRARSQRNQQQNEVRARSQRNVQQPRNQSRRRHEQSVWQQRRANNWQSAHRDWRQRGGYHGYRVPNNYYQGHFGRQHSFLIYGLPFMTLGGYPRFQYNGFWITMLDPWPAVWGDNWYDQDDVYIVYGGDGYYLYNRRYPGIGIAISISR